LTVPAAGTGEVLFGAPMSSNEGGVVDEIAQGFNDAAIYIEANASPFHRWNSAVRRSLTPAPADCSSQRYQICAGYSASA
jgi:hypothetical protein